MFEGADDDATAVVVPPPVNTAAAAASLQDSHGVQLIRRPTALPLARRGGRGHAEASFRPLD